MTLARPEAREGQPGPGWRRAWNNVFPSADSAPPWRWRLTGIQDVVTVFVEFAILSRRLSE